MHRMLLAAVVVFFGFVTPAYAKAAHYVLVITEPFLDLHTGPGRGFPKFHAVDRGGEVEVLKRRTDWFKVRDERGVEGWASRAQLRLAVERDGSPARIDAPGSQDYLDRRWEVGVMIGDFGGADVLAGYGAWHFTRNLSLELWGSDISGRFSSGWMVNVNVVHQPWPEWRISPFLTLGTGVIRTEPKGTLVSSPDRTDQIAHAGVGLRMHLSRRFMLRAEYKGYVVFTSRDENEGIEEWKAGFAFFF
jgi:hypothetical protein